MQPHVAAFFLFAPSFDASFLFFADDGRGGGGADATRAAVRPQRWVAPSSEAVRQMAAVHGHYIADSSELDGSSHVEGLDVDPRLHCCKFNGVYM